MIPRLVRFCLLVLATICAAGTAWADDFQHRVTDPVYPDAAFPQVRLETSLGDVVVELDRRRAPVTVNNFLAYVEAGAYDGTLFHRVVPAFVAQGGGYRPGFESIAVREPIMNESGNGLRNQARTVAMARHDDPHSATSQFYFNLADNDSLDPNRRNWGYAVFGQVIEGWEVVEAIGGVETGYAEPINATDVPVEPVILRRASLVRSPGS